MNKYLPDASGHYEPGWPADHDNVYNITATISPYTLNYGLYRWSLFTAYPATGWAREYITGAAGLDAYPYVSGQGYTSVVIPLRRGPNMIELYIWDKETWYSTGEGIKLVPRNSLTRGMSSDGYSHYWEGEPMLRFWDIGDPGFFDYWDSYGPDF